MLPLTTATRSGNQLPFCDRQHGPSDAIAPASVEVTRAGRDDRAASNLIMAVR